MRQMGFIFFSGDLTHINSLDTFGTGYYSCYRFLVSPGEILVLDSSTRTKCVKFKIDFF